MRHPRSGPVTLLALSLLYPGLAAAQKLDNDDKKFLADVHPLMLADEESAFKKLKDKSDRLEFQKIFWARRDPDLATPENEYQAAYLAARAEADRVYRVPAQAGSTTDCGRTSRPSSSAWRRPGWCSPTSTTARGRTAG
jgi:GWxTD domain-containing protein